MDLPLEELQHEYERLAKVLGTAERGMLDYNLISAKADAESYKNAYCLDDQETKMFELQKMSQRLHLILRDIFDNDPTAFHTSPDSNGVIVVQEIASAAALTETITTYVNRIIKEHMG